MAFPTGWARKCIVTIPDAQISGSNINFPILISEDNLPTEMLDGGDNSALNGGGDVRFSLDSAGATQLPCDVVLFITGGSPAAQIHVKLPNLNTGADRTLYVWYKKAGEVQPLVTAPFGRNAVWADYDLVVHCNSAGAPVDSTGNATVTPVGTITEVTGPFGNALNFAAGAYLNVTGNTTLIDRPTAYPFGVSLWAKKSAWPYDYSSAFGWGGVDDLLFLPYEERTTPPQTRVFWRDATGARPITRNSNLVNPMVIGTWNRFALGMANLDQRLYINDELGADDGTNTGSLSGAGPFSSFRIGGWADGSQDYRGDIAEFRVGLDRSADWLTTEYNNQSNPAAFGIAGTPEAVGGGATLVVNGAISGQTVDNAALSQQQSMSADRADHTQTVDNVTIAQSQALLVAIADHAVASDSPAQTQGATSIVNSSRHTIVSNQVAINQFFALVAQRATHALSSDVAPLFDPADVTPSTLRMQKAERANRAISSSGEPRIIYPINTRN